MTDLKDIKVLDVAPGSITGDAQVKAAAAGIDPELTAVTEAIPGIEILSRIDELPESVVRMLAWENRVYGTEWQLAGNLANRRELVKESFQLNRRRGTRWAVDRVLEVVGLDASINEWFEYGGDPYHFKITINSLQGDSLTEEQLDTALKMVDQYKPLRCTIETIDLTLSVDDPAVANIGVANTMSGVLESLSYDQELVSSTADVSVGGANTVAMVVDVYPT